MVNKKGQIPLAGGGVLSGNPGKMAIWVIVIIAVIATILVIFNAQNEYGTLAKFKEISSAEPVGFEDPKVLDSSVFKFLNYIFGKIPQHIITWTENGVSAAIIVAGIWLMFLLVFGDILSMFGSFSKGTSWLIAIILTIVIANFKLILMVSALSLALVAIFGSLSVIASIFLVFGFFIAFHFGSAPFRQWFMYRRIQDEGLKIIAGGHKAAGGLSALKDIADAAKGSH